MLLAIDVGNTNIVLGVFEGTQLNFRTRIATDPRKLSDEYGLVVSQILKSKGVSGEEITDACLSSVVPPLTPTLEAMCVDYFGIHPLTISVGTRTGIDILYDNPKDVGADRIVTAVAALKNYGGPIIVVDFGTATVFDAISSKGEYLGGAIAPGVYLAAEALFLGTSQLRRVDLVVPKAAIGRNTVSSMQSGLIFGLIGLIEGMVKRFKMEIGDAKVIATGGMAHMFAKETDVFDEINPDLTLIGLQLIYEMNKGPAIEIDDGWG